MEIGSFIQLQFHTGQEWYTEEKYPAMEVARLNSGRAAIYHAITVLGCDTVYLPYYQCETVREFLKKKGVAVKYYRIDEKFAPILPEKQKSNEAIVLVNYYGVFSHCRMQALSKSYQNVVIDNSQAFFSEPIDGCMSVYSARKFVGVPDGAYVIGKNAKQGVDAYPQGYSSDTSLFLLQRVEYGCEGKTYESRSKNEERIDSEDVMKMSPLTKAILDGADYLNNREIRCENFEYAHKLLQDINKLNPMQYYQEDVVPMVYPLLVEDDGLLTKLLQAKHFQGHWWNYVLQETPANSFEYWLSRYMIPITIDQRYGKEELDWLNKVIRE